MSTSPFLEPLSRPHTPDPYQQEVKMSANIIDNCESVIKLVDGIASASPPPFIFVDLEGIDLSRTGSISLMQLLMPPAPVVHLIDVFSLQSQAFNTVGTTGKSLKSVLESDHYVKVFFDVRNDSDALFSHFGIALKGVIDLQLVEYASRPMAGRLIKGLAKCISEDSNMTRTVRCQWSLVKEAGRMLFAPERGGSYAVFNKRPLPDILQDYCVQDVMVLPKLLSAYSAKMQPHMASQVLDESRKRVAQSQAARYNGKGRHMALAPSFSWTRPICTPLLTAPFDVLGSPDLSKYCTMQDSNPALPREEEVSTAVPDHSGSTVSDNSASSVPKPQENLSEPTPEEVPALGQLPVVNKDKHMQEEEEKEGEEEEEQKEGEEGEEDGREYEARYSSSDRWYSDEESAKDYTACSASDCGYCGRCGY